MGAVEIEFEYVMTIDSLSMHFHRVSMDCSINDTDVQMVNEIEIQSYLLMLLDLGNDENMIILDGRRCITVLIIIGVG